MKYKWGFSEISACHFFNDSRNNSYIAIYKTGDVYVKNKDTTEKYWSQVTLEELGLTKDDFYDVDLFKVKEHSELYARLQGIL